MVILVNSIIATGCEFDSDFHLFWNKYIFTGGGEISVAFQYVSDQF